MGTLASFLKRIVAAIGLAAVLAGPTQAEAPTLDELYERLADPENAEWELTESAILLEWSKSGSAAMDLLLKRGQEAMELGDFTAAVEHLTALTDHAPEFAEGWNARATAYFMMGEFGPSLADIRMTLALNPHHFGALSGLGQIFEAMERPEDALKAYRAALTIHPHIDAVRQATERLERDLEGTEL
jgi:tetratricopeptide (TPR) repeat protein